MGRWGGEVATLTADSLVAYNLPDYQHLPGILHPGRGLLPGRVFPSTFLSPSMLLIFFFLV